MYTNIAAWLPAPRARFEVGPAPYTPPGPDEIVVKNRALAINPFDWILQLVGDFIYPWIGYPFILGADLAGEVVEVGSDVTRFKIGDRVLAYAVGAEKSRHRAAEGAFQSYTVVLAGLASPIPDTLSYEDAAVLPLGIATAACALFQADTLALAHPTLTPKPAGKTVIVWGGSTSVGCNAIQLAAAAGYDVIATASPHNFALCERLGASQVFDYHDPNARAAIIAALRGKTIAGAFAIGKGAADACVDVVHGCAGEKIVAMANLPIFFDDMSPERNARLQFLRKVPGLLVANVALAIKCRLRGVRTKFIVASMLLNNDVGAAIFVDFLPRALAAQRYLIAPKPHVIGTGLATLQAGLDRQKTGVSASKVVVTLEP
jgi:NADPH:quinone reductase-like Zn-dependent oxidoreductase